MRQRGSDRLGRVGAADQSHAVPFHFRLAFFPEALEVVRRHDAALEPEADGFHDTALDLAHRPDFPAQTDLADENGVVGHADVEV